MSKIGLLMNKVILNVNNPLVDLVSSVREICNPFFKLSELTYFEHVKIYNDGTIAAIATRPDHLLYIVNNNLYLTKHEINAMQKYNFVSRRLCSPALRNEKILKITTNMEENCNLFQGLAILNRQKDCIELFGFCSSNPEITETMNFYCNNLEVINKFIKYFKHRAENLIKESEKPDNRFTSIGLKNCLYDREKRIVNHKIKEQFLYAECARANETKVCTRSELLNHNFCLL